MNFHPEALGKAQHRVLRKLGPLVTGWGFYLTGGTALALQLGHRRSVDLDWFTPGRLEDPLRLAEELRAAAVAFRTEQVASGTLHGVVAGVRISLLEYRYSLLKPLVPLPAFVCRLAARADLAAMKLAAVAARGAKRDFVDIYALGRSGLSLRRMLAWYQRKYSVTDIAHVLYSLCYFEDADKERMPQLLWDTDWQAIKSQLSEWLQQVAR